MYSLKWPIDSTHRWMRKGAQVTRHCIGTVNLSGRVSRMQATRNGHWVHCRPMQQISAQTRNFWVLEALCSAAVT
jgi:hypothetical protein